MFNFRETTVVWYIQIPQYRQLLSYLLVGDCHVLIVQLFHMVLSVAGFVRHAFRLVSCVAIRLLHYSGK